MRGKRVPDKRRAEAVGLALVAGVPEASKATGVPQRTIRDWKADPEFAELRLSARDHVAEVMWVGIQVGLEHLHRGLANPKEPLKSKSDTVAMLIEKRALLIGEATGRMETNDITARFNDHENAALSDAIRRVLGQRSDESAALSAVEVVEQAGAARPD